MKKAATRVDPTPFIEGLTSDQLLAFTELIRFIDTPDTSMICVKGYAGTGKTFLITRFIKYCTHLKRTQIATKKVQRGHFSTPKISLTAPTNKAVQVLRESSDKSLKASGVTFRTIHQLLGLKEVIDDSGTVEFRNDYDNFKEIESHVIVVIDEVSMFQDELFFMIKNYAPTIKIIMMGDPMQIPPIGKEDSEPFLNPEEHEIKTIELTQIMRQKEGSAIIELSMHVRNNPLGNHTYIELNESEEVKKYSAQHERKELAAHLNQIFTSAEFIAKPASVKIIAWRNAKVRDYNTYVRNLYFSTAYPELNRNKKVLEHDQMITNEPVTEEIDGDIVIKLNTNQEFEVLDIEEKEDFFAHIHGDTEIRYYHTQITYYSADLDGMVQEHIRILHESSQAEFDRITQLIKNSAIYAPHNKRGFFWKEYYRWVRTFANVSYAYAITAHKSQGSTYPTTIVDVNDIMINKNHKERNRILYTAITRAKNQLILIN